jgi:hypothetical protein
MVRSLATGCALALVAAAEPVWADEVPVLVLPLLDALALVERPAAAEVPDPVRAAMPRPGAPAGSPPPPPAFIPKRIHIPDLYRVDVERDAPRFAEPVDNDRMVALEFVPPRGPRPGLKFTYDTESLPIGDSSDRVSIRFELPF